jgi:hypothetical protein
VVIPTLTPKKENWISVIAAIRVEPVATDAIFPVDPSPNQMLPSGPGVMKAGLRQRLGGGGAYAEREHSEAKGKFGSECVAKGGEYRLG